MVSWNATLAELSQASPRRIGNPNVDPTRHTHGASKHAVKRSKRGALADRGANGGMLGNDAKVIFKRNKTADVTGVDNHELNALPMVDATAKTIADKGPVILILRNCACHGLNQTLHSAGQIEWFQTMLR